MAKFDLMNYARRGAEVRAAELSAELDKIYKQFPELRSGRRRNTEGGEESATQARRRRRRTMSAAQRKAVSARMKKYWAARRTGKGERKSG